jgi:hypothetical protein
MMLAPIGPDPSDNAIGPEGIYQLCEEAGVAPEDISMLILAWQLGAQRAGHFTWEEWSAGMRKLECVEKSLCRHEC